MRQALRIISVAIFLGIIFSGGITQDITLEELTPLNDVTFDGPVSNCMTHELSTPGQGLHTSGSGLHTSGSTGGFLAPPTSPALSPFNNSDIVSLSATPENNTSVILIVDDFKGVAKLDGIITVLNAIDWLLLDYLIANNKLSHGALVMSHLNALISGAGYVPTVQGRGDIIEWSHDPTGAQLIVIAVDIASNPQGQIDSSSIASGISNALNLARQAYSSPRLVVNMSFVLLPCPVIADFIASGVDTFDVYVESLAVTNSRTFDEIAVAVSTPVGTDPLNLLFSDEEVSLGVTFVASSGNLSFGFQMFPAAWDNVIGVSAIEPALHPSQRADFSNVGQVMANGAWFAAANLCQNGNFCTFVNDSGGGNLAYAGTSFSAPAMSVAAALRSGCDPLQLPIPNDTPLNSAFGVLCP